MKLLSIEKAGPRAFSGFIEDGNEYKQFDAAEGEELVFRATFPKKDYKSYEFFAAVIGNCDPYSNFLIQPIPLKELSYEALQEACKLLPYGYL